MEARTLLVSGGKMPSENDAPEEITYEGHDANILRSPYHDYFREWFTKSHKFNNSPEERDTTLYWLAEQIRLTREYVGEDALPPIEGWGWFDAYVQIAALITNDELRKSLTIQIRNWRLAYAVNMVIQFPNEAQPLKDLYQLVFATIRNEHELPK